MTPVIADVIVKNPCYGVEPWSWEWLLHGCWMLQSDVAFGFLLAGLVLCLLTSPPRRAIYWDRGIR